MPNLKISELNSLSGASIDDVLPIVDNPGSNPATKKITVGTLFTSPIVTGGITIDNGVTDGGTVFFNGGTTSYLKSNAAGTELNLVGMKLIINLGQVPIATNDASAAIAGVSVGGIYRTNANPSVLCMRSV